MLLILLVNCVVVIYFGARGSMLLNLLVSYVVVFGGWVYIAHRVS